MIGLATIGQAPREDVVESMFPGVDGTTIVQSGALDGLRRQVIIDLVPGIDEHPLVTRLTDGSEVVISKQRVTPFLNDAIVRLESSGATLICVLCTGEFHGLESNTRVVYPDLVLAGVVDALLPSGTLGVLIPHAGQRGQMTRKWEREGRMARFASVSPYGDDGRFEDRAVELVATGAEMIVMDCMGYNLLMQEQVQLAVEVPVILANRTVGAVLASMIPALSTRR